ncbi:MAG: serine hydrolase domain-containing protein, partial [Acidimicrobiia bacterium]
VHNFALIVIAFGGLLWATSHVQGQISTTALIGFEFDDYLQVLRQQAGIPGMSAALVQDGRIVWAAGFGRQDVEANVPATADTPYHIAGLTQTFAATLLLQCAEDGRLELPAPIRDYDPGMAESSATLAHVLTHTSENVPGTRFKFDPTRYVTLTPAIETCTSQPFRKVLANAILDRLAMHDSVPGQDVATLVTHEEEEPIFDPETRDRYARVLRKLAKPYRVDRKGKASLSEYPTKTIDASGGLITTVRDLARFDAALSDGILLQPETLALAWARPVSANGQTFPHGLGWFVQFYNRELVVWQFGEWPNASSSLVVKLPRRQLTLILLANSDGLAAPFQLGNGDVTSSLFGKLFLRFFG